MAKMEFILEKQFLLVSEMTSEELNRVMDAMLEITEIHNWKYNIIEGCSIIINIIRKDDSDINCIIQNLKEELQSII